MPNGPIQIQKDDLDKPDAIDPGPAFPGYRQRRDEPPRARTPWQVQLTLAGGALLCVAFLLFVLYRFLVSWAAAHPDLVDLLGSLLWAGAMLVFGAGFVGAVAYGRAKLASAQASAKRAHIIRDRADNPVNIDVLMDRAVALAIWQAQFQTAQQAEVLMAPSRGNIFVKTLTGGHTENAAPVTINGLEEPTAPALLPEGGPMLKQLRERYSRSAEHLFVGSVGETPVYLRWGSAGVSALIGGSGGGKTNTARLIAAWHALNGGGLAFCDGHGEVRDESLIDSCRALESCYILPPAISDDDILAAVKRMDAIGRARINGLEPADVPLLLVFDEFISVCRNHPKASDIVNMLVNFGDEYRKVNMQALLTVHHGRGDVIDKQLGNVLKAAIGTRIVHNTDMGEAKFWLRPVEAQGVDRLKPGEALFFDKRTDPQKILVPWLPPSALAEVAYPAHPGWPLNIETPKEQQRTPRQRSLDDVRTRMENAPRAERLRVANELASRGAKQREIQYACCISDEAAGAAWRLYHGGNGVSP